MDVGEDTAGSDRNTTQKLVELFVILHSEGDVTRHNTTLLVVTSGITSQLEDFGAKVLKNGGQIDRSPGSHTGGVLAYRFSKKF